MKDLTWNEYSEVRNDKQAFRLSHYSPLFHSAHCKAVIKGMDFILGWDDRYTTKEWNNQVNQYAKRHECQFVEITPIVVEEIKQKLRDYQADLVKAEAHLKTGIADAYKYNSAIHAVDQANKMIKIYTRLVSLLPTFDLDVIDEVKTIIANKQDLLDQESDFYKKRILSNDIEFYNRILSNIEVVQVEESHITPYKGREIDFTKTVMIYKNLTNGLWSIKQGGKVVGHTNCFLLRSTEFKVSEATRQRVIAERKKYVHAYVVGYLDPKCPLDLAVLELDKRITYNPFVSGSFLLVTNEGLTKIKNDGSMYYIHGGNGLGHLHLVKYLA